MVPLKKRKESSSSLGLDLPASKNWLGLHKKLKFLVGFTEFSTAQKPSAQMPRTRASSAHLLLLSQFLQAPETDVPRTFGCSVPTGIVTFTVVLDHSTHVVGSGVGTVLIH